MPGCESLPGIPEEVALKASSKEKRRAPEATGFFGMFANCAWWARTDFIIFIKMTIEGIKQDLQQRQIDRQTERTYGINLKEFGRFMQERIPTGDW